MFSVGSTRRRERVQCFQRNSIPPPIVASSCRAVAYGDTDGGGRPVRHTASEVRRTADAKKAGCLSMNREIEQLIIVAPARYVLLPLANAITGYSVKAMERKIERGDWPEGKVWRRAPDGHIMIDILGYQRWVESP
jgi:hypothetical protein